MPKPTKEQLRAYNGLKSLRKFLPHGIKNEGELELRLGNPLIRSAPEWCRKFKKDWDKQAAYPIISQSTTETRLVPALFSRDERDDPEDNWDLCEMIYIPEGKREIRRLSAERIAGIDMAHAAPETAQEACQYWAEHAMENEVCFNIEHIDKSSANQMETNPAFAEFLKYNRTLYQEFCGYKTLTQFYASPFAMALSDSGDESDYIASMELGPDFEERFQRVFPDSPLTSGELLAAAEAMKQLNDPAWVVTTHALKEQGILGPDTRYQMAFDTQTNERIDLRTAIENYGKDPNSVRFQEMNEEQKKALDDAFRNPVFLRGSTPHQDVSSDAIRKNCRDAYNLLNGADNAFLSSDAHFAKLKKDMKAAMNRAGDIPTGELRKILRSAVAEANGYLKVKSDLRNKKTTALRAKEARKRNGNKQIEYRHSAYTQRRIDAMQQIVDRFSPLLGQMAYSRYKARELRKENRFARQQMEKTGAGLTNQKAAVNEAPQAAPKTPVEELNGMENRSAERLSIFKKSTPTDKNELKAYATAVKQIAGSADCVSGRDLSALLGGFMVREEGKLGKNAPHPMRDMVNKYGAEAFVRGIQHSDVMMKTMNELYRDPKAMPNKLHRALKDDALQKRLALNLIRPESVRKLEQNAKNAREEMLSDKIFREKHKPKAKVNEQPQKQQRQLV